jgi:hypothetical protein
VELLEQLTADVALLSEDRTHLRDKLDANRTALADAIEKANRLRSDRYRFLDCGSSHTAVHNCVCCIS